MFKDQSCLNILQSVSDGILIIDSKKRVHFANKHMGEMFKTGVAFNTGANDTFPLEHVLSELQSPPDFLAWLENSFKTENDVTTDILFKDGRIYECKSCLLALGGEDKTRLWNFRNITRPRQIEKAIRAIIKGTSLAIGLDFFRALVRHLAEILGYRYALIGELVNGTKISTLAVWAGDSIVDNITYDLAGTPCANVTSQGMCLYDSDVQALFPQDHLLVEMSAQSYFGIPLNDKTGKTLGIIVLLDDKPLINIPLARDLLQVFASRAAAELSRMKAEHDLQHREAFEMLLSNVSTHFMELPPGKTDEGIMFTLQALGEFSGLDRAYLFKFSEQMSSISNTHEWCAPEVSCERASLQDVPCAEIPWALAPLLRKETLYIPNVRKIPAEGRVEQKHWQGQEIQSLVCVPVMVAGELHGFMGFDSVKKERQWDESDLKLLKTFSEVIGNALEHQKQASILYETFMAAEADRNKISTILNSVADALVVTDNKKQVLLMNRAAERLLDEGLPKSEKNLFSASVILKKLKKFLGDDVPKEPFDIEIPTGENGNQLTLQARVAKTKDSSGAYTGHVISLRDVTKEREIDRLKSEFISTAAHELNTPLSAIMGYTELMLDAELQREYSAKQKMDFLNEIYSRSEALSVIVDDLLDISRIESRRSVPLNLKECNVADILTKTINHYRRYDPKHDYQLELPGDCGKSCVMVDYHRINQVLENLLSNASKYSPEGKKITVRGTVHPEGWEVVVKDSGIGMNKDQLERVFDKFFRADVSNTAIGGLGLGMSIARQIVRAHGGDISINSKLKKGTTVYLNFPKNPPPADSGQSAHAAGRKGVLHH